MRDVLCHLGAFIGGLDLGFAGATIDLWVMDDIHAR